MDYLNWVENNWGLLGRMTQGHTALYRATGGRIGHRVPGAPPMLLLDHVGAKSGAKRIAPRGYEGLRARRAARQLASRNDANRAV